jgi:hypothetical protein
MMFLMCMMNATNRRNRKVASLVSHAVAALGIGACFYEPQIPKSVWGVAWHVPSYQTLM